MLAEVILYLYSLIFCMKTTWNFRCSSYNCNTMNSNQYLKRALGQQHAARTTFTLKTLVKNHFEGNQKRQKDQLSISPTSLMPMLPPPFGSFELQHGSDSEITLKCHDNWRISQVTATAEEALSVLSQPTSCCDNVSDLGRDNTQQSLGRRGQWRWRS